MESQMKKCKNLNVILIQFTPTPRDLNANISKIENILSKYKKEDKIDIILFPEMALTGYIFDNKEDISLYLEEYNNGQTFDFCSKLSKKFECFVFCGYPEKTKQNTYYNSCMITNRSGEALQSYRKHFLYEMDKTWCIEGEDFGYLEIEDREGNIVKLGIGICMDLNPWEFKAPWEDMEFSTHCYNKDVDFILFLTNWLDNEPEKKSKKEVLHIINYWAMRLDPYFEKPINKTIHFLAANRCGKERETTFIGCSCALRIKNGRVALLDNLNKNEESTILVELKY